MRALTLLGVLLLGLAVPVAAQEPDPTPAPAPVLDEPVIDATKLGVSLSRIAVGLKTAESRQQTNPGGLRLEYMVQVYGLAPKIRLFDGVDLVGGTVPGSAPTHNQVIDHLTPKSFSAPALPVSALAFWAADWMFRQSKKSQCEQEIEKYRSLIMQGVNVSAPRCTQQ
jgi:hypothetical protein